MSAIPGYEHPDPGRYGALEDQIVIRVSGERFRCLAWGWLEIRCHIVEQGQGVFQAFRVEVKLVHENSGELDHCRLEQDQIQVAVHGLFDDPARRTPRDEG